MNDIVIFDLDGTLALINHRRHFVENGNRQWREFFAACVDDAPNIPVICVCVAMDGIADVWIVSGRSDEVKAQTVAWLAKHRVPYSRLLMRKAGDHQPDDKLKRGWLADGTIPKERVLCVFDDRDRVVKMWREEGLQCSQVAPGDF